MATSTEPVTFFFLCFSVAALQADSPAFTVAPPTVNPTCLNVHCSQLPTCEENDPLKLCAIRTYQNTKNCGYPYDVIGTNLYLGYTKVFEEYCNTTRLDNLRSDIDYLAQSTSCWNDSLFCIAKPLGIDSGTKLLNNNTCSLAWSSLDNCSTNLPWDCKRTVMRISPILYNTLQQCENVPITSVSDAASTATGTSWLFVLTTLTMLMFTEWHGLRLDQCPKFVCITALCCAKKTLVFECSACGTWSKLFVNVVFLI